MADTRIAAIDASTTIVGFLCRCVGVAFALLAAAINPLVSRLWQPQWLDHADVNFEFACWALGCGCALCLISMRPPRSDRGAGILLALLTLASLLLLDRGLLAFWGRSPWITDAELHYRHRPSVRHSFASDGQLAFL